mmetsp:Transcript_19187/g.39981  ORF Transcript_19187/g.39981 Transcript_19187/m.39981 type:complete len:216 (+) Transcript_19187:293-940(+)
MEGKVIAEPPHKLLAFAEKMQPGGDLQKDILAIPCEWNWRAIVDKFSELVSRPQPALGREGRLPPNSHGFNQLDRDEDNPLNVLSPPVVVALGCLPRNTEHSRELIEGGLPSRHNPGLSVCRNGLLQSLLDVPYVRLVLNYFTYNAGLRLVQCNLQNLLLFRCFEFKLVAVLFSVLDCPLEAGEGFLVTILPLQLSCVSSLLRCQCKRRWTRDGF